MMNFKEVIVIEKQIDDNTDKPIVDCEIKEPINKDGIWDNTKANPFMFGFLYKGKLTQIICFNPERMQDFAKKVRDFVETLPKPLYGLNWELEHFALLNAIKSRVPVIDVRKVKGRFTSKKEMYGLLMKHRNYPEVKDSMNFDGNLCIAYYQRILTGDPESEKLFNDIVAHNYNCVTMESIILREKEFLESCYELDGKGWVIRLKKKDL